ncbi:hypothetical protein K525DRAFT_274696 [Schizophyllum commune Loenen D]|nr:hypothetical protein K525DRAFT_274696 [Schizophyllum commune Loenen D]
MASPAPAPASIEGDPGPTSDGRQAPAASRAVSGGDFASPAPVPASVSDAGRAPSCSGSAPLDSFHGDPRAASAGENALQMPVADAARASSGGVSTAQVPLPQYAHANALPATGTSSVSGTSPTVPPPLDHQYNAPPQQHSASVDGHALNGDQGQPSSRGRPASSASHFDQPNVDTLHAGSTRVGPTAAYFPPPPEGLTSGSQSGSYPTHSSTPHGQPKMDPASYTSPDAPAQSSGYSAQDDQMNSQKLPVDPDRRGAQSISALLLGQNLPGAMRRLYIHYQHPFWSIPNSPMHIDVYLIRQAGPPPSWILVADQIKDRFNDPHGFVVAVPSLLEDGDQEAGEASDSHASHAGGDEAAQELAKGVVDSSTEGRSSTARPASFYINIMMINSPGHQPLCIGFIPPASTRLVGGTAYAAFPDPLPAQLQVSLYTERHDLGPTWRAWLTVLTVVGSSGTFTWDSDILVEVGLTPPARCTHPRLVLADCDLKACMWSYLQSICIGLSNMDSLWWNLVDCYGCPLAHVSFGLVTSVSEEWFRQAPLSPHLVSWKNGCVAYTATVDAFPASLPGKGHALDAVQAKWLQDFLIARDTINLPSYPTIKGLEEISSTKFVRTKAECTAAKQTEKPQDLDLDSLRSVLWHGPRAFSNCLRVPSDLAKTNIDFTEIDFNQPSQVAHIDTFLPILDFYLGEDVISNQIRKMPQEGGRTYNGVQFWTVEDMVKGCSCPSTIVFAWSSLEDIKNAMAPLPLPPVLQSELQAGRRRVPIAQVVARYFNCTVTQIEGACKLHLMILRPDFLDQLGSYRTVRYAVEPTNKKWMAMFTLTNAEHILDTDGAVNRGKLATAKKNQKKAQKKAKSEAKARARAEAEALAQEKAEAKKAKEKQAKAAAKTKGKTKAKDTKSTSKAKPRTKEAPAPAKKGATARLVSRGKAKPTREDSGRDSDASSASDTSDDAPEERVRSTPSTPSESSDGEGDEAFLSGIDAHGAAGVYDAEETSEESEGAQFGFYDRRGGTGGKGQALTPSDQSSDEDEQPSQDELDPSDNELSGLPSQAEWSDAPDAEDGDEGDGDEEDGGEDEEEDQAEFDDEEDEEDVRRAVRARNGRSRSLQAPPAPPQIRRLVFEQTSRQASKEPSRRGPSKKKSHSRKVDPGSDSDAVKTEPEEYEDDHLLLHGQAERRARAQPRGLDRQHSSRQASRANPVESDEEDASDAQAGATRKRQAKLATKTKRPVAREPSPAHAQDAPLRKKSKHREAGEQAAGAYLKVDAPTHKVKNRGREDGGGRDADGLGGSSAARKKVQRGRVVDESEDEEALAQHAAIRKSKKRREREEEANVAALEEGEVVRKKVKRARERSSAPDAGARASSSRLTPSARGPSVPPKMRAKGKRRVA